MLWFRSSGLPKQAASDRLRVFFSYSRKEMTIADRIAAALEKNDIEAKIDRRDIPFAAEWKKELACMIFQSNKVLWLVSQHSLNSKWCRWELRLQKRLKKQLLPIAVGDLSGCEIPSDLEKLQMLQFHSAENFETNIETLVQSLLVSQAWVKQQTLLQIQASSEGGRLRGAELLEAERWLRERPDSDWLRANPSFAPRPTVRVEHFITNSRRLADRDKNRTIAASMLVMALAIGAAVTSYSQWRGAQIAESQSLAVAANRTTEQGDAASGLLLALKGLPEKPAFWRRPVVVDPQSAIYRSLFSLRERRVLEGHEAPLTYAETSHDGRWVLTSSEDGSARLWNLEKGLPSGTQDGNEVILRATDNRPVKMAVFSPDTSRIVTVSDDHAGVLWDAEGRQIARLEKHTKPIGLASFSDDGTHIVTAGEDYTARLWSGADGRHLKDFIGHKGNVVAAAFSPDGKMLATASADRTARLWQVHQTGKPIVLDKHRNRVLSVAFDPTGAFVATASRDDTAIIWTAEGDLFRELIGHDGDINRVRFAPQAGLVVTASDDNTAKLWDIETGTEHATMSSHGSRVIDADFSSDGSRVLTASVDGAIGLWRLIEDGESYQVERIAMLRGHERDIVSAKFSRDGEWILSASKDHTARIWQATEGARFADSLSHPQDLRSFAYSHDGKRMVAVTKGGLVRIWDTATHTVLNEKDLLSDSGTSDEDRIAKQIIATAFSTDGKLIALGHEGGTASLYRPSGKTLEHVGEGFVGHKARLRSVDFSSDDAKLVTSSADGTAKVWDVATRTVLVDLDQHDDRVRSAVFSPDDQQILTSSADRKVRLWSSENGKLIKTFDMHEDDVWAADFSPDGKTIVTGSEDGQAFITELARGGKSRQLVGHGDNIRSAEFSRDGRHILTSSWDRTVRLWDSRTAEELAVIPSEDIVLGAAFDPSGQRIAHLMKNLVRFRPIYPDLEGLIKVAKERAPRDKTREERQLDANGQAQPGWFGRLQGLIPAIVRYHPPFP